MHARIVGILRGVDVNGRGGGWICVNIGFGRLPVLLLHSHVTFAGG